MEAQKQVNRFTTGEQPTDENAERSLSRVIAGAFFCGGLLIGAYLFRAEQVWLRNFALLLLGLSVVRSVFEPSETKWGPRPIHFLVTVLINFGVIAKSIMLVIAILPIIIFELLSGPAALLGAILFTISIPIYALESKARVDVVPVDLSHEVDTMYLVILGAVGCWGVLLLRHYVLAKYGIMEKIYDRLADGFRP